MLSKNKLKACNENTQALELPKAGVAVLHVLGGFRVVQRNETPPSTESCNIQKRELRDRWGNQPIQLRKLAPSLLQ